MKIWLNQKILFSIKEEKGSIYKVIHVFKQLCSYETPFSRTDRCYFLMVDYTQHDIWKSAREGSLKKLLWETFTKHIMLYVLDSLYEPNFFLRLWVFRMLRFCSFLIFWAQHIILRSISRIISKSIMRRRCWLNLHFIIRKNLRSIFFLLLLHPRFLFWVIVKI